MKPARSALPYSHSMGAFALTALLALTAATATRAATVLVDDQFNDSGLTDGADPLDAAWTRVGGGGSLAVTSNTLTQSASTFFVVKGAFTNTTALTNGGENNSITLSLDMRATATPGATDAGFRFGLGTSTNSYVFHIGTGGTASGGFVQWAATDATAGTGLATTYATSPTPLAAQSITNTANHTFSLTITRSGASSLSFRATLDGTTYTSVSSNSIGNFTFDRVILGQGGTSIPFAIDNVNVTLGAIPEPSAYATLAGLGALGLVALQRRRGPR